MNAITASDETLMQQAHMTARDYMLNAVDDINEMFGKDYAAQHPDLVAAYMQTAAIDFATSIIAKRIESTIEMAHSIGEAALEESETQLSAIAEAIAHTPKGR